MQFSDLYGEVINLRFNSTYIPQAKSWVNLRYTMAWNQNEWTFRYAPANPTVTAGSNVLTGIPTALQRVSYLWDQNGAPVAYLSPQEFFKTFWNPSAPLVGNPEYYTVINGTVYLGPTPVSSYSGASGWQLVYEQKCVPMVNDTDVPLLPVEYHYLLVHGALATGLTLVNDFTYAQQEEMWQEGLQNMSQAYTSDYGGTLQYQADALGKGAVYQAGDAS